MSLLGIIVRQRGDVFLSAPSIPRPWCVRRYALRGASPWAMPPHAYPRPYPYGMMAARNAGTAVGEGRFWCTVRGQGENLHSSGAAISGPGNVTLHLLGSTSVISVCRYESKRGLLDEEQAAYPVPRVDVGTCLMEFVQDFRSRLM